MDSSVLYIPIATPAPLKSLTVWTMLFDPSAAVHFISNWPAPGIKKSVARYYERHHSSVDLNLLTNTKKRKQGIKHWYLIRMSVTSYDDRSSPASNQSRNVFTNNWLSEHSATKNISQGAVRRLPHFLQLKFYEKMESCNYLLICLVSLSSNKPSTRFSSGVIVAHLMPTLYFLIASAQSIVTWSSVASRFSMPRSNVCSSTSKKGKINLSLMMSHITLVISSPRISTTGPAILIIGEKSRM